MHSYSLFGNGFLELMLEIKAKVRVLNVYSCFGFFYFYGNGGICLVGASYGEQKSSLLELYIDTNKDKDFSIFANTKSAYFIVDLLGEIAYANHLEMVEIDYSSSDLGSMKIENLFAPTELNKRQTFFKDRDPETLSIFNTQMINSQGKTLDVRITFFPLYDSGEHLGTFILIRK